MFLLGIASLLQLVILPGFIILRLLKVSTSNALQSLLYSMGLSLYVNYCAVCTLTWLRLYMPPVVYGLFALELAAAILLLWRSSDLASLPTAAELSRRFSIFVSSLPALQKYCFIAACLLLLFFASLIPFSAGTAYYFSDALMHWTRWPVAWAANSFPTDTRHYPQLFPTNLSLIYVFTGEPALRFFPKLLMPAFFIGILLMFIDLFTAKRSFVYLAGFFVYSAFLLVFYSVLFILEVNADIPVSFFAFLTFYALVRPAEETGQTVLLAAVFAVAAANTKLAGMYILLPAGAWIALYFYRRRADARSRDFLQMLLAVIAITAAGFFWYAVRPAEMLGGLNQAIYLKPEYASRFFNAASMLLYTAGAPFILVLALTFALSAALKEGRMLLGIMIVPALVLWMFFFSADYRNLSFVIPFAALASAYGMKVAYQRIVREPGGPQARIVHLYRGPVFTLIKIAVPLCIIAAVQTDAFFNFCMSFAYGLNAVVFRYYRLVYTTELGYYRSVELYRSALSLAAALTLVIMAVRPLRVKAALLALGVGAAAVVILAGLLPADALWRRQANDEAMTSVRNCYYRVRPYLQPRRSAVVMTNNAAFAGLISPHRTSFIYAAQPNADSACALSGRYDQIFILLGKADADSSSGGAALPASHRSVPTECFNDGEFILYRIAPPPATIGSPPQPL